MKRLALVLLLQVIACAASNSSNQVDQDVRSQLATAWKIKSLKTTQRVMDVLIDERKMTDTIYLAVMPVICLALVENKAENTLKEIRVWNAMQGFGYTYETPSACSEIVKTPVSKLKLKILGNTHTAP